jgi:hypothetical protein
VLTVIVLSLLFGSTIAARKDPTPGNLASRRASAALLAICVLVSGGYALGKEMAQRDNAEQTLRQPSP